jgi:hypothetical protein
MLGGYAFTSLAPGAYDVRQILPAGWVRTGPAAGSYHVDLALADSVVGRDFAVRPPAVSPSVFYNNSAFDGRNPAASADDDGAVVPAKRALLPGQSAALADVTGYSKGLNGVMIDLPALPAGADLTAGDFAFRASPESGSTEDSPLWFPGPTPSSVTVRRGAGAGGTDRVTLIWPDFVQSAPAAGQAVANGWLEVTVKSGARTGLAVPDVFYFGNQIGDTGDSLTASRVNALDLGAVKRLVNTSAGIASGVDVNHDGRVNALDLGIVKANLNRVLPLLSDRASAASGAAAQAAQAAVGATGILAPTRPAKPWDASDDGVWT